MSRVARSFSAQDTTAILRRRGGVVRPRDLAVALGISRQAAHQRLLTLVEHRVVKVLGRGWYQLVEDSLDPRALRVVRALEPLGGDAHLTGLDVLGWRLHQHYGPLPSLVSTDRDAEVEAAMALRAAGLDVSPVGTDISVHSRHDALVILIREPVRTAHARGVGGMRATPEKAWVDLTKAVSARRYPISGEEVGRVLGRCMSDGVIDRRLLARAAAGVWRRRLEFLWTRSASPDSHYLEEIALGVDAELT